MNLCPASAALGMPFQSSGREPFCGYLLERTESRLPDAWLALKEKIFRN